jgi:hypothetical protein
MDGGIYSAQGNYAPNVALQPDVARTIRYMQMKIEKLVPCVKIAGKN